MMILSRLLMFVFCKFGVKTCYCKVRDLTSATLEGDKVELGRWTMFESTGSQGCGKDVHCPSPQNIRTQQKWPIQRTYSFFQLVKWELIYTVYTVHYCTKDVRLTRTFLGPFVSRDTGTPFARLDRAKSPFLPRSWRRRHPRSISLG